MPPKAVRSDTGQPVGNGPRLSVVVEMYLLLLPRLVSLAFQLFSKLNRNNVRRNCISSNESFPSFCIRLWR